MRGPAGAPLQHGVLGVEGREHSRRNDQLCQGLQKSLVIEIRELSSAGSNKDVAGGLHKRGTDGRCRRGREGCSRSRWEG